MADKLKTDITSRIEEMLSTYLEDNALELYRTEYKKEGPNWVLRVFLDKPIGSDSEYVSIDECEGVNKYLSDLLDEQDFIDKSYNLEVSSPGLDRELIKDSDFIRFEGSLVEVRTYGQINGSKEFEGILKGRSSGEVTIETADGLITIPEEKISKINLAVVF